MRTFAALVVLIPGLVSAQDRPALKARELFYTPQADPPKPAAKSGTPKQKTVPKQAPAPKADPPASEIHTVAATVPLGLRYAVLKRDSNGQYAEVDPDTNFRSGDRIRIKVDANTSGYLYVVMQGSSGNWQLLFPAAEVAGGSNHIQKGESRQIPPGNSGQFVFDEQAGTEKIFIVLTRQPEPDLDKLIYAVGGSKSTPGNDRALIAKATVRDDLINRLRGEVQARDLVFEKVDSASTDTNGHLENAAYVVNPSTAPDARLVVDLALRHR